jgi:hypothetical protein
MLPCCCERKWLHVGCDEKSPMHELGHDTSSLSKWQFLVLFNQACDVLCKQQAYACTGISARHAL